MTAGSRLHGCQKVRWHHAGSESVGVVAIQTFPEEGEDDSAGDPGPVPRGPIKARKNRAPSIFSQWQNVRCIGFIWGARVEGRELRKNDSLLSAHHSRGGDR